MDEKQPAQTDDKQPAQTDDKQPAQTDDKPQTQIDEKEPQSDGEKYQVLVLHKNTFTKLDELLKISEDSNSFVCDAEKEDHKLVINPSGILLTFMSQIHISRGEDDNAMKFLEAAVQKENGVALYMMSVMWKLQGNVEEAGYYLEKAVMDNNLLVDLEKLCSEKQGWELLIAYYYLRRRNYELMREHLQQVTHKTLALREAFEPFMDKAIESNDIAKNISDFKELMMR